MTTAVDAAELKTLGRRAGLDAVGIASAERFDGTRQHLLERRAAGLHGGMNFTYRNPERSTDPGQAVAGARALVVGARRYPAPSRSTRGARVAAYATDDHYRALRTSLDAIANHLRTAGWTARVLVDDNALVDREAAYRAGLGWYGKNANVLLPGQGSWFVLGSVVTTAPLDADDAPVDDGCGACRRCIDGCPTGAIVAPGVVDARRCLAWLLQAKGDFPLEHRVALGDRIYGCDECQEVCPPNRRGTRPSGEADGVDLVDMLQASDDVLLERFGRWYIAGREPRYLRRNALVVLGNTASPDDAAARSTIEQYRRHPDAMLRSHADWAAERVAARA